MIQQTNPLRENAWRPMAAANPRSATSNGSPKKARPVDRERRLRVLSDRHREFGPVKLLEFAAEVVVLDVAGNHEQQHTRFGRLHEGLSVAAVGSHAHVLEDGTFEVGYGAFLRGGL